MQLQLKQFLKTDTTSSKIDSGTDGAWVEFVTNH